MAMRSWLTMGSTWRAALLAPALAAFLFLPSRLAAEESAADVKALERQLTQASLPVGDLWVALWSVGERGTTASALVPAVAPHLAAEHELTRRLAAEALGRIGADSPAAVAALREALPRATGAFEEALLRALVALDAGVPFRGTLPGTITYASTPCLQELERAYAQKFVRTEDLPRLEACRKEARAHAQRLETDHVFRLGEQTAANVAGRFSGVSHARLVMSWSAPFLLVGVVRKDAATAATPSDARVQASLASAAQVCQAVYRKVLADHASDLDVRALELPHGGRADMSGPKRSFEDGFPLQVWLVEQALLTRGAPDGLPEVLPRGTSGWWDAGRERAVIAVASLEPSAIDPATELLGRAAAGALLEGFGRQRRDWREMRNLDTGWLWNAALGLWGAAKRDLAGGVGIPREPESLARWLEEVRQLTAEGSRPGDVREVWMPLRVLLATTRRSEGADWASQAGFDPRVGELMLRAQGVGFALFLRDHASAARRSAWTALLRMALQGTNDEDTRRKALGVRDVDDLDAIDAEFKAWWLARQAAPASSAPPAAPAAGEKR